MAGERAEDASGVDAGNSAWHFVHPLPFSSLRAFLAVDEEPATLP